MSVRTSQSGIGHVVLLLFVVVILGAISFAGYTVWQNNQDVTPSKATQDQSIQTTSDLNQTQTLLDNTASQLDSDLDTTALDANIDELL